MNLTTDVAIAYGITFLSQTMDKSKEEIVKMLLVEALTARGLMKPMEKK